MIIHIVTAEHFNVPGLVTEACADVRTAEAKAAELINLMLKDSGRDPVATAETWPASLEWLQDYHGAAHCYVDITERELIEPSPSPLTGPYHGPALSDQLRLIASLCGTDHPQGKREQREAIVYVDSVTAELLGILKRMSALQNTSHALRFDGPLWAEAEAVIAKAEGRTNG
jgi:hypothetical protein